MGEFGTVLILVVAYVTGVVTGVVVYRQLLKWTIRRRQ